MSNLSALIVVAVALAGLLGWLLIPRKHSRKLGAGSTLQNGAAPPSARHYAYFPLIRQALSAGDSDYLLEAAPPEIAKRALRERRQVARHFLRGLREDFWNLEKLGRIIAALSPEVSRQQETERLVLSLKFQALYAIVSLRLSMGDFPLHQVERLTGLVGQLATRMDAAMVQISALASVPLGGKLGV